MNRPEHVVRIVGGGATSEVERAAIVAALTQNAGPREEPRGGPVRAWAVAARLEGVGLGALRARSELPRR